jgi:hypothetical protein
LLDDAITLVTSNWRTLVPVTAVVVLPAAAAYSVVASFYIRSVFDLGSLASGGTVSGLSTADTTVLVTALIMQGLGLLYAAAKAAFDGALYASSSELLEHRRVRLKTALRAALKAFLPIVLVELIVSVTSWMAGVVSLGIGAVVLGTLWSVAYPAVVLEGGIGPALSHSFNLVKRHFWRVLLITIAIGLLGAQFEAAFAAPTIVREIVTGVQSPADLLGQIAWGWKVFDGLAQGIAIALVLPFTTSATLLNYLDLRARDEGMDLVVRARALLPG